MKKKDLCGININQIEIETDNIEKVKGFYNSNIYEAQNYQKVNVAYIQKKLKQDNVKIKYLIGKRGKIEEQEYKNIKNYAI